MRKISALVIVVLIFSCNNYKEGKNETLEVLVKPNSIEWVTWESLSNEDKVELATFWKDFQKRLSDNNKDGVTDFIQFPLDGEWAFVLEVKKSEQDLTKEDFKNAYSEVFGEMVRNQILEQSIESLSFQKNNLDNSIISFQIGASLNTDTDEFESSARLFNFCKTKEGYKLCCIFHVG